MAAMMVPSALPTFRLYRAVADSRTQAGWFAASYVAVWAALGLLAAAVTMAAPISTLMGAFDARALAIPIAAAAVYQLSATKRRCLVRCRSPLGWMLRSWRDGRMGAIRMGLAHAGWCGGCCAGLVVALLALGAMNIAWMGAFMLLVLAEKASPLALRAARGSAAGLFGLAAAFAVDPRLVGWLT